MIILQVYDLLLKFKDDEDKTAKCKKAWNQIDPKEKDKMEKLYKEELKEYKEAVEKWKKKHGLEGEDLRVINKEKVKESAVEKAKGSKSMPKDKSEEKRKSDKKGNSKEEEKRAVTKDKAEKEKGDKKKEAGKGKK